MQYYLLFFTMRISLNPSPPFCYKWNCSFSPSPSPSFLCHCFVIILLTKLHLKVRSQIWRNYWEVLYYSSKAFQWALDLILYKICILVYCIYQTVMISPSTIAHLTSQMMTEGIDQCFPT